jgi:hypothetical protein
MTPRVRAALLLATLGALGCTTDPATQPIVPVASVAIIDAPIDNVYLLGYARQLSASAFDPRDLPLVDRRISWRSSKPSIAFVTDDGIVEGLMLGTTTITLESEGITSSRSSEVREGIPVPGVGPPATTSILGDLLTLSVPVGVAAEGFAIHAKVPTTWPVDDRLVSETVVELGPAGIELAAPITPGIRFDPLGIPAIERPLLRLFAVASNGTWTELPAGAVDLANSRVSGDLTRLTKVAVFRKATPTELVKVLGDGQSVAKNTAVPIAPTVLVLDAAGRPVSGIQVTFTVGPEGGQITGAATATSAITGLATIPGQWRVGANAGTYTLVASIVGGITTTFTATALP